MVGVSANFTEGCFLRPSLDFTEVLVERLDLTGMTLVWHEDVEDTDEECTRGGAHRGRLFADTVTALVGFVH
jgi:hypothetical protein